MLLQGKFPTIVMLHYVSDNPAYDELRPWNISRESFIRLLDYIEKNGYRTTTFENLLSGERQHNEIIITFDDCPKELWDFAIPELLKRNMKAVFYIPTAHLGGHNQWNVAEGKPKVCLMDEDDVRRLLQAGMEVGSHAHDHVMLGEMVEQEVRDQLNSSKTILERLIARPVISIAYPYGSLPHGYTRLIKDAGYHYGLGVYVPWQSLAAIRRWVYDDTDTEQTISKKMSTSYNWYRALHDKWDFYTKRILRIGYNRYMGMKKIIRLNMTIPVLIIEDIECTELLSSVSGIAL